MYNRPMTELQGGLPGPDSNLESNTTANAGKWKGVCNEQELPLVRSFEPSARCRQLCDVLEGLVTERIQKTVCACVCMYMQYVRAFFMSVRVFVCWHANSHNALTRTWCLSTL
jgi:hypothetical protein